MILATGPPFLLHLLYFLAINKTKYRLSAHATSTTVVTSILLKTPAMHIITRHLNASTGMTNDHFSNNFMRFPPVIPAEYSNILNIFLGKLEQTIWDNLEGFLDLQYKIARQCSSMTIAILKGCHVYANLLQTNSTFFWSRWGPTVVPFFDNTSTKAVNQSKVQSSKASLSADVIACTTAFTRIGRNMVMQVFALTGTRAKYYSSLLFLLIIG